MAESETTHDGFKDGEVFYEVWFEFADKENDLEFIENVFSHLSID